MEKPLNPGPGWPRCPQGLAALSLDRTLWTKGPNSLPLPWAPDGKRGAPHHSGDPRVPWGRRAEVEQKAEHPESEPGPQGLTHLSGTPFPAGGSGLQVEPTAGRSVRQGPDAPRWSSSRGATPGQPCPRTDAGHLAADVCGTPGGRGAEGRDPSRPWGSVLPHGVCRCRQTLAPRRSAADAAPSTRLPLAVPRRPGSWTWPRAEGSGRPSAAAGTGPARLWAGTRGCTCRGRKACVSSQRTAGLGGQLSPLTPREGHASAPSSPLLGTR